MQKKLLCTWPAYAGHRSTLTKFLLVMKLTTIFLTAAFLHVQAAGHSQQVTYSGKNVPLEKVFQAVKKQTGYVFFYNAELLQGAKPVDIEAKDLPLEEFLNQLFKDQGLAYSIKSRSIVVSRAVNNQTSTNTTAVVSPPIEVKGRVINDKGEPLSGASVNVKGTEQGTFTDIEGNFIIHAEVGSVLIVSFVGYENREIKVSSSKTINVSLELNLQSLLNEVVVNKGYYTEKKRLSTGNVSTVTAKDIERQPVTSPLLALQGRVPGLEISPNTGVPGGAINIRIRGLNSLTQESYPLYIIDGVPVQSTPIKSASLNSETLSLGYDPLGTINPSNIETIEILKDADATSIYGSRGTNGVILITTRQGKRQGKTNMEISLYSGSGRLVNRMKVLNTEQYLAMRKEAFANDSVPIGLFDFDVNGTYDSTRYTNWQDELLGGRPTLLDCQMGLSGGNANTSFRVDGGFHKEDAIYPGDFGQEKISALLNINHRSPNEKFKAAFTMNYGLVKNRVCDNVGYVQQSLIMQPNAPALYDSLGNLNWPTIDFFGFQLSTFSNPIARLQNTNESTIGSLVSNVMLNYNLLPSLGIKVNAGFTELNGDEIIKNPLSAYSPGDRPFNTGSVVSGNNKRNTWIVEPQFVFSTKKGNHHLNWITGITYQRSLLSYLAIQGNGYTSDLLLNSLASAPNKTIYADIETEYKYSATYMRLGYDWKGKYLLNATGRRDGSSRFGPGNQFGNFCAIGVGWIFTDEKVIRDNLHFLSFGKIRASYGITGNDLIQDYKFYNTYSLSQVSYQGVPSLSPTSLFNPNYQWEETRKMELSLELALFKDRVSTEVSWYRNRSSNQLLQLDLPYSTGFGSVNGNFGATVENTGWEFVVSTQNIYRTNFKWSSFINISIPKNRLLKFPGLESSPYAKLYEIGKPLSVLRQYTYLGVNSLTGEYEVKDINKDGIIDANDQSLYAADIRFYGGVNNQVNYKALSIAFLFQFSSQIKKEYAPPAQPGFNGVNMPVTLVNGWNSPGDMRPVGKYSQSFTTYSHYTNIIGQSTYGLVDAFFVRLKTISISYQLPPSILEKVKVKDAAFFLQGQNLLTFTDFLSFDPETGTSMPPLRIITAGIQIKL